MATTKIWSTKGTAAQPLNYIANPGKTENPVLKIKDDESLKNVLGYAADGTKTEKQFFVTGINCNETYAYRQFKNIKEGFGKENGIVAFHGYQSFKPNETTPDEAHKIGVELANRLWGDAYQVLVATHLNTDCVHNHFVVNSVSFRDGRKFHADGKFYRLMKEISDEICRDHGLSVIDNAGRGSETTRESQKSRAGMPTRYNVLRKAIDDAISVSCNMREFERHLNELGYRTQFSSRRKYWTVTPVGWDRPVRLMRLGENYTNERIFERVMENPTEVRLRTIQRAGNGTRQYVLLTRKDRIKKRSGLKGLYLRYCYELGYLPRYTQNTSRVHHLLHDELKKCELYSKQARLLSRYDIRTEDKLKAFVRDRELNVMQLKRKRDLLRKKVRRVMPQECIDELKRQIAECTEKISENRNEYKLSADILERHEKVRERLCEIDKEREREVRNK